MGTLRVLLLLASAVIPAAFSAAGTETEPAAGIIVQPGDCLIRICRNLTEEPDAWREVARFNQLKNPNLIHPRQEILIPLRLLKGTPVAGVVRLVQGNVRYRKNEREKWRPLAADEPVEEGSSVKTADGARTEIEFANGPRITQRPQTAIKIAAARRSDRQSYSRYKIFVGVGKIVTDIKKATGKETLLQIETPNAICGARGTAWRTAVEPDATSQIEVLEGNVLIEGMQEQVMVAAGEGALVRKNEPPLAARKLLTSPVLIRPAPTCKKLPLRLAFAGIEEAAATRLVLARDEQLHNVIVEKIFPGQSCEIPAIEDGTYYAQAAGIDRLGLEGLPSVTIPVVVRVNPVAPYVETPEDKKTYRNSILTGKWLRVPDAARYQVQIAETGDFSRPVRDRNDITTTSHSTCDLPFKTYYFRVRSIASDGYAGEWSDALTFTLEIPPPPPAPNMAAPQVEKKELRLRWPDQGKECSYRCQLAKDSSFAEKLTDEKVATPEISLARPKEAGTYFVRTNVIDRWGQEGAFSKPQSFEIIPPPTPELGKPVVDKNGVAINWQNLGSDITYRCQVASDSAFSRMVADRTVEQPQTVIPRPDKSGTYYVRVRGVDSGGCEGAFSDPRSFELRGHRWIGVAGTIGIGLLFFLLQ